MSVVFNRGYQLGREDLNIYIENAAGLPTNPAEIYYALYDFTSAMEALVGPPQEGFPLTLPLANTMPIS